MEGPDSGRGRSKRDREDGGKALEEEEEAAEDDGDDGDWEGGGGSDRWKDRSGKQRRCLDAAEEPKEQQLEGTKRRYSGGDGRKRSSSNRAESGGEEEEDNYDVRRDSWSKPSKRASDDRSGDRRSGDGYREVDRESGGRRSRADDTERESDRKVGDSQGRSRSRAERGDADSEKGIEKESRHSDRKDGSREKAHGSREQERNPPRRRWDEGDPNATASRKVEESSHGGERSDSRAEKPPEHGKHRSSSKERESSEAKNRSVDLGSVKGSTRSVGREEKRVEGERIKGKVRSETQDEDLRQLVAGRESKQDGFRDDRQRREHDKTGDDVDLVAHRGSSSSRSHEKEEKQKQQREMVHGARDDNSDVREKSGRLDEDGRGRMRDRSAREVRPSRRSRTPEKRHFKEYDEADRGYSESDNERGGGGAPPRSKEWEKDGYRDDRSASKVKESGWSDRSREREPPKDYWKRSHAGRQDRDHRDGDADYDYEKDWDAKRRDQEWVDGDKLHSRTSYNRRDSRNRHDNMRSSSNFGHAHEHSDSIEIRPNKSLDFGKEESVQMYSGRRAEAGAHQDVPPVGNDEDWSHKAEEKRKLTHGGYVDDVRERYTDDGSPMDQNSRRNFPDARGSKGSGQKGPLNPSSAGSGEGTPPVYGNNQGPSFNNRPAQQGAKGPRNPRGGRGRLNGRDTQRVGLPLPVMGPPPFGHLAMSPGPLQPLGPNMSPSPAPPIGPNVFMPPFPGPLVWQGPRGMDVNVLAMPPALSPIPPGPLGSRFPPNLPSGGPNHGMYMNQPGPGRGAPHNVPGPGFNQAGPIGRGSSQDKAPGGWVPNRGSGPAGKAPSRGEQNDYSQNFVDTGMRPQNFIRELELTSTVEDYPKLRELIQKKDEIVAKSASPPMYFKCDLRDHILSSEFFGAKFDVILVDPPWEEYVHRAPGVADHMEYWAFEEILNLRIEAIADTPSFIFLWVGDGVGLEQGRQCLKKWGFRRCEDICWVKTNKTNAAPSLRHDSHTLFQHSKALPFHDPHFFDEDLQFVHTIIMDCSSSKRFRYQLEHCLMGIKGTVRRSSDGHIIHANIDTDIIIAEEPPYGSTKKPEDIYRIIEHFSLGRRRIELFGEDHNIRSGWLTVGKELSSSNFNSEVYCRNFSDKDGKVWQGGGGRNPPPDAPHLVQTTPEIESLRPKSPPQKNQQPQPGSLSATSNSTKRQSGSSHPGQPGLAPGHEIPRTNSLVPWASSSSSMGGGSAGGPGDKFFDGYVFNPLHRQVSGDRIEFDPHRPANMM